MAYFESERPLFSSMADFNTSLSSSCVLTDDICMDVDRDKSKFESSDPVTKAVVDNIMGKLPTKKPVVMKQCNVCKLEFTGQVVLDMHLAGAKHAKKVKAGEILQQLSTTGDTFSADEKTRIMKCEACNIIVNSTQQLQTHLSGNKHKQKALKMSNVLPMVGSTTDHSNGSTPVASTDTAVADELRPGITVLLDSANPKLKKYFCETCKIPLNSEVQVEQHLGSKKHKDKLNPKPQRATPYSRQPRAAFSVNGKKKNQSMSDQIQKPLARSFVTGGTFME